MQSYIIRFEMPIHFADFFAESLSEMCNSVRTYEKHEDSPIWICDMYYNEKPDDAFAQQLISQLSRSVGLPERRLQVIEQENKNWVEELSKNFQPIEAGRFYIYSQFSQPKDGLINLRINPGMAFGTGQHETTYLCLEAINWLKDNKQDFRHILDLGAGSGILAIACAKVWEAYITATDIDPIATTTAEENAAINKAKVICKTSNGFENIMPGKGTNPAQQWNDVMPKFDLILANILMNPLLEMAENIAQASSKYVVLSGFKTEQTEEIMAKYNSLGFKSAKLLVKNHWVSAILLKESV